MMDHSKLDIYEKISKLNDSQRETEAKILTKGALKLKECIKHWDSDERKMMLSNALHFNQKVWSIFQTDLTSRECRLPKEIQMNLLKLGIFVDKQIISMMIDPSPEKLIPIINVNLSLAAGLRGKPPGRDMPDIAGLNGKPPGPDMPEMEKTTIVVTGRRFAIKG